MAKLCPGARNSRVWALLALLLVTTTALQLFLSWLCFGFSTGDDVEILQSGFARAYGLEYTPWTIRHLLLPDVVVAPALRLASRLGATTNAARVWAARWPFVLLSTLNIWLVFRLGLRWLADERPALLAAALYGLHWLPLGYGATVYPRTATTSCVMTAAILLSVGKGGWWRPAAAGGLLAVAFAFRFSELVFLLPCVALAFSAAPRSTSRWRPPAILCVSFGLTAALVVGVEDWLSWGRPFSSLVNFFHYTLIDRASSSLVAVQPVHWYLWRLPKWLPLPLLPFLIAPLETGPLKRPLSFAVLPLLVLTLIHHKELRYLQGVVPFVSLAAAAGAWQWWCAGRRRTVALLLAVGCLFGLRGLGFLGKSSMAAVLAAREINANREIERVALAQAWAYGPKLELSRTRIRDLPVTPALEDLERVANGCEAVALYHDVVQAHPELAHWLATHGFEQSRHFSYLRSREVVLFLEQG